MDLVSRRISFFDKEGKYLSQIAMPEGFGDLYINSKGWYVSARSIRMDEANAYKWGITYGLYDSKFKSIAEFFSKTNETKPPARNDLSSMAQFMANTLSKVAFQPQPMHLLAKDDHIYFGYSDKYEIHVYSPEGKKIKIITREYEPIKIGKKDEEYFKANLAERFLRSLPGGDEKMKSEILRLISFPKNKPAYYSFALMENGWLAVTVEFIENEYTLFDIFDQEGRYIAQFKADIPPEGLFFKNGKAYSVATKDGYKFVKRYAYEIQ